MVESRATLVMTSIRMQNHHSSRFPQWGPASRWFLLSPFSIHPHLGSVKLSAAEIRIAVKSALSEDLGSGDATTLATVPKNLPATALMRAREPLTVAGIQFAAAAFQILSP